MVLNRTERWGVGFVPSAVGWLYVCFNAMLLVIAGVNCSSSWDASYHHRLSGQGRCEEPQSGAGGHLHDGARLQGQPCKGVRKDCAEEKIGERAGSVAGSVAGRVI